MNICFTCHRYAPLLGGPEIQLRLLAENLSKFFNVKVVTFKLMESPEIEISDHLEVYRVSPQLVFFRVPFSFMFMKVLRKLNFDIMHTHGTVPCISDISVFCAKFKRKLAIYTHHFDGNVQDSRIGNICAGLYNKTIGRFSVKFSDAIIATSKSYARASPVIKHYLDKVITIPYFVDTSIFKPQPTSTVDFLREKLGLRGKKVILFVGRIVPYKGLEYLIKAFEHICEIDKDFHLLVIGEGEGRGITNRSSYHERIREHVNKNDVLKSKIHFLGGVPNQKLPPYYSLADVLVLSSVRDGGESFGIVLLEALSCGTPVVASNLPGVQDVLKGNYTIGSYVPPKDGHSLAQAIIKMAYRKNEIAERATQFVIDNYEICKIMKKYVDMYLSFKQSR